MLNLTGFLAKFKHVLETTEAEQEVVARAISEELKMTIPLADITTKNGDIVIAGSPALKSKIFISKAKILAVLQEKFPKKFRSIR